MLTPSANLAGIMLIIGGALCYVAYRNLAHTPPHYKKVGNPQLAAAIQWVTLAVGVVLLVSGVAMGFEVMQAIAEAPFCGT